MEEICCKKQDSRGKSSRWVCLSAGGEHHNKKINDNVERKTGNPGKCQNVPVQDAVRRAYTINRQPTRQLARETINEKKGKYHTY